MHAKTFALGVLTSILPSVLAYPTELLETRSGTPSETGTNNGYYYTFYTDGGGNAVYTNEAAGEYKVVWTNSGDFVAGKGWNPGSAR